MSSPKLDLCFVCDTTGSMSSQIAVVQKQLKAIAEAICASEKRDLQLACVEYKDHCDSTVANSTDFTGSVSQIKKSIDSWAASGGGDHAECMADGLHAALKLNWRPDSTKLLLLCADAPPHGVGAQGDDHPNGCPLKLDPLQIVRQMITKEIVIYTVGVNSPDQHTVSFLCTLSRMSGGRFLPLAEADNLPTILLGGAEEELQLAKFEKEMELAEKQIRQDAANAKEALSDEVVAQRVALHMREANVKTKKLQVQVRGGGSAWKAQEERLASAESLHSYAALNRRTDYSDAPSVGKATSQKVKVESDDFIDHEQVYRVMKRKQART